MNEHSYWVYILTCKNGSYYTGFTNNLKRRYQEHVRGTSQCKYTRSFPPINIAAAWQIIGTKAKAMQVERFIKSISKKEKEKLILYPSTLSKLFSCVPIIEIEQV